MRILSLRSLCTRAAKNVQLQNVMKHTYSTLEIFSHNICVFQAQKLFVKPISISTVLFPIMQFEASFIHFKSVLSSLTLNDNILNISYQQRQHNKNFAIMLITKISR